MKLLVLAVLVLADCAVFLLWLAASKDDKRLAELEQILGLPQRAAFATGWGPTDDELVRLAEHDRGNGLL